MFQYRSRGFPGGSVVKNLPANTGDMGLIPDLGRSQLKKKRKKRKKKVLAHIDVFLAGGSGTFPCLVTQDSVGEGEVRKQKTSITFHNYS